MATGLLIWSSNPGMRVKLKESAGATNIPGGSRLATNTRSYAPVTNK